MLRTTRLSAGRAAAIAAAWTAYVALFVLLYPVMGSAPLALGIIPVLVMGVLLGAWAGLGAGVGAFALNLVLLASSGEPAWDLMLASGSLLDSALTIVVGVVVGRLRDLSQKPGLEPAERRATQELPAAAGRIASAADSGEDRGEKEPLDPEILQNQKLEAIGRLAGGVAHDFNNLLTAMIGYATFARDAAIHDAAIVDDIDHILKAAQRAADLTRQLLAFSRRQVLTLQIVDLNELIVDLTGTLRRLLGEEIDLEFVPGEGLGSVAVDRAQIQQVLLNLVLNARDAMPAGGRLTITTTNATLSEEFAHAHLDVSAGDFVQVSITDSGAGMTEDVRAHLFEPFFTTKEFGRGMGLATAFGVVKQHGGNLLCDSEPGRGTTFHIYLPGLKENSRAATRRDAGASLPRGTETVLVAEDEPAVRRLVSRLLRGLGYAVLEAADGEEALQIARGSSGAIDLLVSDVVMPKLGGLQLAAQLRQTWPALPALFMSGYATEPQAREERAKQGLYFLAKPFPEASLARMAREALDNAGEKAA